MAARKYTGSWSRNTRAPVQVALHPQVDPQHLNPDPTPEYQQTPPAWVSTVAAPDLPPDVMPATDGFSTPLGGGGPIDGDPLDPADGVGRGAGLTLEQAQALRGALHGQDRGTVAARTWQPTTDRDGSPHAAMIDDVPGHGDSPETLVYQRTGVGQPHDPYARTGRRQKRWWDRIIDRHMWDAEYRPWAPKYARSRGALPVVANPTQLDSPFVANGPMFATDDRFVAPVERRTPRPWDESLTTDPSTATTGDGLTVWGL